jgi:hypothetical protein
VIRASALRALGEGSLLFHATGVVPIWSELSQETDASYPLARNILLIIAFVSIPYLVCLFLSHALYRQVDSTAPVIACIVSVAMFATTLFLWLAGTAAGDKGGTVLPLIVLQGLAGMAAFAFLRHHFTRKRLA